MTQFLYVFARKMLFWTDNLLTMGNLHLQPSLLIVLIVFLMSWSCKIVWLFVHKIVLKKISFSSMNGRLVSTAKIYVMGKLNFNAKTHNKPTYGNAYLHLVKIWNSIDHFLKHVLCEFLVTLSLFNKNLLIDMQHLTCILNIKWPQHEQHLPSTRRRTT